MELVFATNNLNKLKEIQSLVGDDIRIIGLKELGFSEEIPEDHDTLEENALQKAHTIASRYGVNCFADDTGLEIFALNGQPGVYSARYAGEACNADDNIAKVLGEMQGKTRRNARFRTVIALTLDGNDHLFEGEVSGQITEQRRGAGGFGYDPVFLPDGFDKVFAEMSLDEKNAVSHRARAFRKFLDFVKR